MCIKCNNTKNIFTPYNNNKNKEFLIATLATVANLAAGSLNTYFTYCSNKNSTQYYYNTPTYNTTPVKQDTKVEEKSEEKKELTDEEIKEDILKRLENTITNLDDNTLNTLVIKYKEMQAEYNYDKSKDTLITLRLANFVKGQIGHQKFSLWAGLDDKAFNEYPDLSQQEIALGLSNATETNEKIDLKKDDNKISLDKLKNLSLNYIAYTDENNNEAVDLIEFFKYDLISYYVHSKNLDIHTATTNATQKIEELNLKTNEDVINMALKLTEGDPSTVSEEEGTLLESVLIFNTLNQNNTDTALDLNELMAYYASMANFNTNDNYIDMGDYSLFRNSILKEEELINTGNDDVNKTNYFLQNYYKGIINQK